MPGVERGEAGGFDEPWQAQLFALTQALQTGGAFTQQEWSEALGAALEAARERDGPQVGGADYWSAWMAALEQILRTRGHLDSESLAPMVEAWRRAYLTTPHGQPVELDTGSSGP